MATSSSMRSVNWSGDTTLTLSAFRDINVARSVTICEHRRRQSGHARRQSGQHRDIGTINISSGDWFALGGRIDWSSSTGNVDFYYNPSDGYSERRMSFHVVGQRRNGRSTEPVHRLHAGEHVSTNLQAMASIRTLGGTYALGRDISMATTWRRSARGSSRSPVPSTAWATRSATSIIAPTGPGDNSIGLFAAIGTGGVVRNLNLDDFNVTANPNARGAGPVRRHARRAESRHDPERHGDHQHHQRTARMTSRSVRRHRRRAGRPEQRIDLAVVGRRRCQCRLGRSDRRHR